MSAITGDRAGENEEDPFSLFDGSTSDSDSDNGPTTPSQQMNTMSINSDRLDANGILTSHPGIEMRLLLLIKQSLPPPLILPSAASIDSIVVRCNLVLSLIDTFCKESYWMMHVGDEKGAILKSIVLSAYQSSSSSSSNTSTFNVLELGTYCGYSAILLASALLSSNISNFKLTTFEVISTNNTIASSLFEICGLTQFINAVLIETIKQPTIQSYLSDISFLFVDHDKDLYLPDLQHVIKKNGLKSDAVVVADNVLIAKIEDYLGFVRGNSEVVGCISGDADEIENENVEVIYAKTDAQKQTYLFKSSTLYKSHVEYCNSKERLELGEDALIDGLEVSVWRGWLERLSHGSCL